MTAHKVIGAIKTYVHDATILFSDPEIILTLSLPFHHFSNSSLELILLQVTRGRIDRAANIASKFLNALARPAGS